MLRYPALLFIAAHPAAGQSPLCTTARMEGEGLLVKARGLPWSATAQDVMAFFSEVNIVGGVRGVHFGLNRLVKQCQYVMNEMRRLTVMLMTN